LKALFGFLGEPYAPECLIPLRSKINSSNVPAEFKLGEPRTDPLVIERATKLYAEIERNPQSSEVSTVAIDEMEATFKAQVNDRAMLRDKYTKMQTRAQRLAREINDKRTTISMLRARHWRNRLRQLVFRQGMVS
jgi:predicted RNase H-like nuclease (RuvC/YqgF family)